MTSGTLAGQRCLVLGAGGFIGFNLCRALAAAGARVHGFGRTPKFGEPPTTETWTNAEFGDHLALRRAVEGMEVVFHLLGGSIPGEAERDPVGDLRTNAVGSLELLSLCQSMGVHRLVFVSSGGTIYGPTAVSPISEDHPTNPISVYGIHKLLIEKHLGMHIHRDSMQAMVLRAANPYGPYQRPGRGQGLVVNLITRRLAGQPVEIWGDGSTVRDYLHVDDLVRAMLAAAVYEGPYRLMNVGSGIGRSINEVVAAVDQVLGLSGAEVRHLPGRAADVPSNVLDVSRIRTELGWSAQIGWLNGLRHTADWVLGKSGSGGPAVRPAP
ncbi:NAD-dependent epimerase/dehydratase family protein [Roseomonas xinghualingensis]|uniref:NAD-dependent epimerase/dehydratase family protein n=1 Tax=Roseomonas xinghualingensis TaxID=2986475 RepID=UPI0021F1E086|nr:NAD-dependent epimerase/dehydratase family protein [Roseomonas sp. SXEYE001]MCV4209818.1 NAD-dependent epimerase/dehydratase family protein [Roseomonas sp. SXEYE001]